MSDIDPPDILELAYDSAPPVPLAENEEMDDEDSPIIQERAVARLAEVHVGVNKSVSPIHRSLMSRAGHAPLHLDSPASTMSGSSVDTRHSFQCMFAYLPDCIRIVVISLLYFSSSLFPSGYVFHYLHSYWPSNL